MNGEFFALAFLAALNPKLLAVDLLLIENRRPRAMFLCLLLGGMAVGVAVGLLDVLVLEANVVTGQRSVSAGIDLALGLVLVAAGGLLVRGARRARQHAPARAGSGEPAKAGGWAQRVLSEPRLALAVLIGAVIGTPGAAYLTALHHLKVGHSSAAIQVIAIVVFVTIEFALIIIPFVFLEVRPEPTKARLKRIQVWFVSHARQLMAAIALLLGTYLVVTALVHLS